MLKLEHSRKLWIGAFWLEYILLLQGWESLFSYPASEVRLRVCSPLPPSPSLPLGFLRVTCLCAVLLPFPSSASWCFFCVLENSPLQKAAPMWVFGMIWREGVSPSFFSSILLNAESSDTDGSSSCSAAGNAMCSIAAFSSGYTKWVPYCVYGV